MPVQATAKNSTTVRTQKEARAARTSRRPPLAITAARFGLRVLAPTAPSFAAAFAERLFLTAPRHRRPAWEEAILATAEPFEIPHQRSFLPAWRWGVGASTVLLVHGWEGRGSQLRRRHPHRLAQRVLGHARDAIRGRRPTNST